MRKVSVMLYAIFEAFLLSGFLLVSCQQVTKENPANNYSLEGKKAVVYMTAKDTDQRMAKADAGAFFEFKPNEKKAAIIVDPNKRFQSIVGIGGALTDASAETFYKLPEKAQKEFMDAYFSKQGIDYSLCRTHIHSCDFSSESYTYTQEDNDTLLNTFTIQHDQKYKLPFIKEAMAKTDDQLKLLASPWSPPAWMKTNNEMLYGGKLKSECYQPWANYIVKFLDAYTEEAIPIWGITVQNEAMARTRWESCQYTAEEERDFVKNNLGPAVRAKYPDTKIIFYDHNRGTMVQRAKVMYDDPEAAKYVWGIGFHWYVNDNFDNVKLVAEAYPDKNLLFTEGCVYPFNIDSLDLWKWGETYGRSMVHDFNNGAAGWLDWNVLLDQHGGPNHVYNLCYAPIIGNTDTGELHYMNSYYYLGHFSKFIRPDARRVLCSSNKDDLLATAFINPDGSLVVVALNLTDKAIAFNTWIEGKALENTSPAHSIQTIVID